MQNRSCDWNSPLILSGVNEAECIVFYPLKPVVSENVCIERHPAPGNIPACLALPFGQPYLGYRPQPNNPRLWLGLDGEWESFPWPDHSHGQDVTIEQELMSIRRKAKEIRCIAPTLRGLYEYQASKTINWGTGEHFHMARWCLENEMLDEAGIHFQWLKARLPEEPKIRQLEIHLREKLQNDPVTRASFALPDQPSRNSRVQKAVDETPQEATADLSADLVVEYREFVVPILRSRCGQAGCHGLSSGQAFVVPPNKSQSPNSLSKSLNGAVAAINMESYRDSPLLRKAVQPHGVQNQPPIDIGRAGDPELLEKLVGWIQRVALQQQRAGYMPMASSPSQAFYPQATSPSERPMTPYTPPARAAGTMEGNQILSLEQAIRDIGTKRTQHLLQRSLRSRAIQSDNRSELLANGFQAIAKIAIPRLRPIMRRLPRSQFLNKIWELAVADCSPAKPLFLNCRHLRTTHHDADS